jgi:nitrite reductase/ring-hydroxylating ferredoxin subunit
MPKPSLMTLEELESRRAVRFVSVQKGVEKEGFAILFEGQLRAYENRCRHLPLPLDYGDGKFFDTSGRFIVCQNHGAIFDPLTGQCLRGPCAGGSLTPIQVEIIGHEVRPANQDVSF